MKARGALWRVRAGYCVVPNLERQRFLCGADSACKEGNVGRVDHISTMHGRGGWDKDIKILKGSYKTKQKQRHFNLSTAT
jgi:hypothetical protein